MGSRWGCDYARGEFLSLLCVRKVVERPCPTPPETGRSLQRCRWIRPQSTACAVRDLPQGADCGSFSTFCLTEWQGLRIGLGEPAPVVPCVQWSSFISPRRKTVHCPNLNWYQCPPLSVLDTVPAVTSRTPVSCAGPRRHHQSVSVPRLRRWRWPSPGKRTPWVWHISSAGSSSECWGTCRIPGTRTTRPGLPPSFRLYYKS